MFFTKNKVAKFISLALVAFVQNAHAIDHLSAPDIRKESVLGAKNEVLPGPIATMLKTGRGVSVMDKFLVEGTDITAWVMLAGNERRVYYVPGNSNVAILGLAFDSQLNNLTTEHAKHVGSGIPNVKKDASLKNTIGFDSGDVTSMTLGQLATADASHVEGSGKDIFVMYDPACKYCHQIWRDTRGILGKARIHWIPVAKVSQSSAGLAEVILSSTNPAQAFGMAVDKKISPAEKISARTDLILKKNSLILEASGKRNVPYIVFSSGGKAYSYLGAPNADVLKEIIGEKAIQK